jgi:hypothetical protein
MEIHPNNRRGSVEQVIAYCRPIDDFSRSHWGPGVCGRLLLASSAAILLQWGTALAAIGIVYYTPTVGLGCRSLSYLLYAVVSTLAWIFFVASSIVTHYFSAQRRHSPRTSHSRIKSLKRIRKLAIWLRRVGKSLSAINVAIIIAACALQFSNVYNECYCNSSVIGLGRRAYDVIVITADELKKPWFTGVTLACTCAGLFAVFVNVLSNPIL